MSTRHLVLVIVLAMAIITDTSLKSEPSNVLEKPFTLNNRRVVHPKIYDAISLTQSSSPFFLNLLKYKYLQKIERISTTPPTTDCICVPYYLCDSNRTIITDGIGAIDIRYRRCTGDLEVCCRLPNTTGSSMAPVVTPTVTPTTQRTTPTTSRTSPTTPTTSRTSPTTPTTSRTTPTTSRTSPTTPTTSRTTATPMTIPTVPPIIFPTGTPAPPITILPTGIPGLICICVPSWQCDPNGAVIFSGEGIINPRQQISPCPGVNQVCCRIPSILPTTAPIITPSPGQTQICIVCGNTVQCTNAGIVLPPVGGNPNIDPRFQSGCFSQGCCQGLGVDGNQISQFGPLRNPGTPQACYCVKTWLCTEGNAVSFDGAGVIDPRFSACPSADEVCCRPSGIDTSQVSRSLTTGQDGNIVIGPPSAPQSGCGIQNTKYAPVSYVPAQPYPADSGRSYFAEFPWMVALLVKEPTGPYTFKCGGSLINNQAILTAAHCISSQVNGKLVARLGQWNIKNSTQPVPYQEIGVRTVIPHPLFYSGGLYHDVAVLILESPVNYTVNVNSICLPQQGTAFAGGTRCYGMGWGRNSFGGEYQSELRKVELPVLDRIDCQNRLRTTRLGPYFQLHGSFICAGGEANKDTCGGDGGGPLACPLATGQFVQVGIVSWGIGCGESNVPAVYASVPQHRQWIDQQLANYGIY